MSRARILSSAIAATLLFTAAPAFAWGDHDQYGHADNGGTDAQSSHQNNTRPLPRRPDTGSSYGDNDMPRRPRMPDSDYPRYPRHPVNDYPSYPNRDSDDYQTYPRRPKIVIRLPEIDVGSYGGSSRYPSDSWPTGGHHGGGPYFPNRHADSDYPSSGSHDRWPSGGHQSSNWPSHDTGSHQSGSGWPSQGGGTKTCGYGGNGGC